ncbi:hypothetical protein V2J09_022126 [Rumex salicifolius]
MSMNPQNQKPWKVEYAKSSRSSCRTCRSPIAKEELRLGKMVQSSHFDGLMPMWSHADCIMRKAKQIKSLDDVGGIESLRWEDQQMITKYIEGSGVTAVPGKNAPETKPLTMVYGVEVSKSSRVACKKCNEKIMKGELRLSAKPEGKGARVLSWYHANCFIECFPSVEVEKLSGWCDLPATEQSTIHSLAKGKTIAGSGPQNKLQEPMAPCKRKKAVDSDQISKIAKTDLDVSARKGVSEKNTVDDSEDVELKRNLEAQTKELWALKDDLKKHVGTAELRKMLDANDQDSTGGEQALRDCCADGMLFGALKKCPVCSGRLRYTNSGEWSKCSYVTTQPERVKGKWKIPEGTENQYLCKWYKSQKTSKLVRILPSGSSNVTPGTQGASRQSQSAYDEKLRDLRVAISGSKKESLVIIATLYSHGLSYFQQKEFKTQIEAAGGQVYAKIKKDTNCLVVLGGGELAEPDAEIRKARRMKIPIVREEYLANCIAKQKKLPFDLYKIEAIGESASMTTIKVKGRSAVHEASGLQDCGHILEDGPNIYNTTLNMSDLSTGVNSYYILQIIEEDKGPDCHVFRKWGRVGDTRIKGEKIEEMSKQDAIEEFKRLFLEKTGNQWETWVHRKNFQKLPRKYFPLDIDYGANKQVTKKKASDDNCQLAPALAELIKMLFNVEAYRAAMMEFEINLSEMPLGKLSKGNIERGYEALTQLQNLLSNDALDPSIRESRIVDASNKFFTMIPSIHPHIIRDEDDFKSKVKMLEALQDIEIASNIVGFGVNNEDSLDENYKKLHCDISPLPHDSEEFRLIEKYLMTTHAPTHTEWALELEEVFSLEREGELDKYAPYREKLGNRMLLWHGSRLTNYVGILSEGLRIAPPEVPVTGYMFGKGIYFADLVSKSAQYCYTDKKNPVGLMLLSEVALGEVYELKQAKFMEKPPRGKHSTKGLGKKIPQPSEYAQWRDGVVVPCGKPVDSKVKASELMYNEYIVYNTAQVKMQFLLKVRFQHKR